jgi:serine protease Do
MAQKETKRTKELPSKQKASSFASLTSVKRPLCAFSDLSAGRAARNRCVYPLSSIFYPHCSGVVASVLLLPLALALLAQTAPAQITSRPAELPRSRYRNGEGTLRAFAPISEATRYSIVKFNVDGSTVALGTVVDTNGLALTKASEIKKGKLTCWLAIEKEVAAEVIATDEDKDVALVRVHAQGLKPVRWDTQAVSEGQWAVTPGIAETPQAVGIISALPHRIRGPRAFIGVSFGRDDSVPKIQALLPGLGAEKAGLTNGDVIVALNQLTVTNREQILETLSDLREGQIVKLRVRRGEKEFDADVRLMVPHSGQLGFEDDLAERQPRLTGQVSQRSGGFELAIEHDSVLPPWSCGGPLVNLDGKAIGLNIARASRVSSYALPTRQVLQILDGLKAKAKAKSGGI